MLLAWAFAASLLACGPPSPEAVSAPPSRAGAPATSPASTVDPAADWPRPLRSLVGQSRRPGSPLRPNRHLQAATVSAGASLAPHRATLPPRALAVPRAPSTDPNSPRDPPRPAA
jgi:hypothetical protein